MNWAQFVLLLMTACSLAGAATVCVLDYRAARRRMAVDLRRSSEVLCDPDVSTWRPAGGVQ